MCSSLITSSFLDIFGSLFSNGGSSFVDQKVNLHAHVPAHVVCVCVRSDKMSLDASLLFRP